MINNIRILRDFRNYFMELKHANIANRFELAGLEPYFPLIASPNSYFKETDPVRDPINLLHLMGQVNEKITGPDRGKIIELYTELFVFS